MAVAVYLPTGPPLSRAGALLRLPLYPQILSASPKWEVELHGVVPLSGRRDPQEEGHVEQAKGRRPWRTEERLSLAGEILMKRGKSSRPRDATGPWPPLHPSDPSILLFYHRLIFFRPLAVAVMNKNLPPAS